MRRTSLLLALLAVLLAPAAVSAVPSLSRLARDVSTALRTARQADAKASRAMVAAGVPGPSGGTGVNGSAGADGAKGAAGTDGARGIDGSSGGRGEPGARGETGTTGPAGVDATSLGFAHSFFDRLDDQRSTRNVSMVRGINQSAAYCFKVAGVAPPRSASVSLDGTMVNASNVRAFVEIPAREACPGADVSVLLADSGTGPVSGGFFVVFR